MKTFNAVGNFEVSLSYDFETELEIVLKNKNLNFDDWTETTGRVTGDLIIRNMEFDVDIEAETEEEARKRVLEILENDWDCEDGVEIKEINLMTIEITEITE